LVDGLLPILLSLLGLDAISWPNELRVEHLLTFFNFGLGLFDLVFGLQFFCSPLQVKMLVTPSPRLGSTSPRSPEYVVSSMSMCRNYSMPCDCISISSSTILCFPFCCDTSFSFGLEIGWEERSCHPDS
jgi:hypothetical protein